LRLKKITLMGFKSFAYKTTLTFHPGITAIVGPNGCGKSNVADSFRWVLGEQSAKSLRGHKMQDVIFAGTTQRAPLNLAEVTITFTEVQGALPIEFDEVAISRRLHRSGDSEYLLNGTEVRLKDIQGLFLDSGIGKEAFSIFEQGKIDQVIHDTPIERRAIFEEAAGIVRFLHRKKEALRKLEQTDLNLSRVEDILREVNQRVVLLEQQAAKAIEFKEKKAFLDKLEKLLMETKWSISKQKQLQLSESERGTALRIEEQTQTIQALRDKLHQAKVATHECETALKSRSEEMYQKRNERDLSLRDKKYLSQRREELQTQIGKWTQEKDALTQSNQKGLEEQQQLSESHDEIKTALAQLKQIFEGAQQDYQKRQQQVEELRTQLEQSQKNRLTTTQAHSGKTSEWKQLQARLGALEERLPPLAERAEILLKQRQEATQKQQERSKDLANLSKEIDIFHQQLAAIEKTLNELKEANIAAQVNKETLAKESATLQARLGALKEMRKSLEGFSTGCKRLLKESETPQSPLYNKVSPLYAIATPPSGSEGAFFAAMHPYNQTLVVASPEHQREVLAFAKKHQLNDISLFCMNHLSPVDLSQHFLIGLEVADEGIFVDGKGVLFFQPKREGNAFLREAEITQMEEEYKKLETRRETQIIEHQQLQKKITDLQNERSSLDKTMRSSEMKLVEINHALLRHQADVKRLEEEYQTLEVERAKTHASIQDLTARCSSLNHEVTSLEEMLKGSENTFYEQQSRLETYVQTAKEAKLHFETSQRQWQETYSKDRQQTHALELLAVKQQERDQTLQKLQQQISQAKSTIESMLTNSQDSGDKLEEVQKLLERLESSCAQLEKNTAESKTRVQSIEEQIQKQENILKSSENEKNKFAMQLTQQITLQESLEQTFEERFSTKPSMPTEVLKDIPGAEKELRQHKQELDAVKDINMLAIEECAQDKERSTFLSHQVNDLKSSKQELVKVIAELDSQSRKLFKETFILIRASFQKNFAILFNGGEADLQFVEGEDILEAGIDITARPPGKQMRSISLLSGGEKCLTAMALLFALFEVKPTPFCILDEIDAPLDDTNVERFLTVVKQFVDRCQFIIITHNKCTMAIADMIYGVSMPEKGISKLLSMEFAENQVSVEAYN